MHNRAMNVIAAVGGVVLVVGLATSIMAIGAQATAQTVGASAAMPYDDPSAAGWSLVAAAVAFVVSLIVAAAKYIGVTLGEAARARLHSAVLSWARAAVARGLTIDEARRLLPSYLTESIADSMRRLQPAGQVLDVLLDGYFEVAKAETLSGFVEMSDSVVVPPTARR